ncbi:hypothetical protein AB205_0152690 [Aquarana catesbeiana]|uniref:Uncharacterized protein n=1 Tax=Aquarana catesbeiana TaxID=8400 RepID=A0A2G9QAP5_AQUCT|nr:hypothetical protein AB205_0152690 [Aquarana catesbeiana]
MAPLPAKYSRYLRRTSRHSGGASQDGHFQVPSGLVHLEFRSQAQLSQHSWQNVAIKSCVEHSTPG